MQNLHLLECSVEAFGVMWHNYQCSVVLVELAMMVFVMRFLWVGMAEMLVWLACVIASKSA